MDNPVKSDPTPAPRPSGAGRESTLETSPEPGAMVVGRYRLENLLGKGGMGSVWRGFDEELERPVAIKFMTPEVARDPMLRERFNREAKAAARLRTRHVVQVHEYGVDGETPYIVMELLDGEDLQARLRRDGTLEPEVLAPILMQTAKALRSAQKAGVIHRDLKPANIFLARDDEDMVVKVLDFGVAKVASKKGEETTKSGVVFGSPPYMSPEQVRGKPLDHRADLWSLTSIAYRAISGHRPFDGDNDGDVVVKICTETPEPPTVHKPSLPEALDVVFAKAFQRDREERYPNARAFVQAFCEGAGLTLDPGRSGRFSLPDGDWTVSGLHTPPSGEGIAITPASGSRPVPTPPTVKPLVTSTSTAVPVEGEATPAPRRRLMAAGLVAVALGALAGIVTLRGSEGATSTGAMPAATAAEEAGDTPPSADEALPTAEPTPTSEASVEPSVETSVEPSAEPSAETTAAPSSAPSTTATAKAVVRPKARPPVAAPPPAAKPPPPPPPAPTDDRRGWGY